MKIQSNTIIISDIHLGSPSSQVKSLLYFLENIECKLLIINGDMFEDIRKLHRLKRSHWDIISQIRKMSDKCEVVWVWGNHDTLGHKSNSDNIEFLSRLIGIKIVPEFQFEVDDLKYIATHGDKWDNLIYNYPFFTWMLTGIYDHLKEFNSGFSRNITKWLKRKSKLLMRNIEYVKAGAIFYAEDKKVNGIFCGHTHHVEIFKLNNIIYANSGTWESAVPSYISINGKEVSINRFDNNVSSLIIKM